MFGIKLEKKVKGLHEKNLKETETVLVEINKQLEYEAAEDRQILRNMGIDKSIRVIEDKQNYLSSIGIDNKTYVNGCVLTYSQIKELAIKYRLRFLRTDDYKGYIPPNLASIIKRFGKDHNRDLNYNDYQYRFYILAPAKSFKLRERPKPVDPLIFYKTHEDNYVLVHKWGNDLNFTNEVKGWFMKDTKSFLINTTILSFVFWFGLLFGINVSLSFPIVMFFITIIATFIVAYNLDEDKKFSTDNWNQNYK